MTLQDAVKGKTYRIMQIEGGCNLNCRLCAVGMVPNETFKVLNHVRGGPTTVLIKGTRLAIGRGMSHKIIIKEVK